MVVGVANTGPSEIVWRRDADSSGDSARAAWLVFSCVLVASFVFLIWEGRGTTFFYDQWGWIEYLRNGLHSILASYNDHMLVVPLAVNQALMHTVGLGDYSVYRVFAALGHVLCAALVFEFARRRIGLGALLLAVPIAFLGTGWENELLPVNFGFPTSMAFGIAALLMLDRGDRRGDAAACVALVVGLLFSELAALFAIGIAAAWLLFDRSLKRVWAWAAPLVLYGVWWIAYYEPVTAREDLIKVPKFAADMAASAAGGLFNAGLQRGRLVLLVLIFLIGWRLVRRHALSPTLVALLVTTLVFWLLVAFGRNESGLPWASHYVYIGAVLIVLVLAESLRGARLPATMLLVVVGLALLATIGNVRAFARNVDFLRASARAVRSELGALRLARATAPPNLVLDSYYTPQVEAGPYFAAVRQVGSPPADSPAQLLHEAEPDRTAADSILERAGELQLSSPAALQPAKHPLIAAGAASGLHRQRVSCAPAWSDGHTMTAELPLPPGSGLELQLAPGPPAKLWARRFASGFAASPVAAIPSGRTSVLRTYRDSSNVPWRVQISATQALRVCSLS